jgi:hypothetical protein
MSSNLSRLCLFQRHLRSLVWVWVRVWDWIHSHTPRTRSPSSRHPPFTHYPFPLRSLVCGGQPSPHKPRLVLSHSTCPPLSSSPHAHSFVLGTAIINTTQCVHREFLRLLFLQAHRETAAHFHATGLPSQQNRSDNAFRFKCATFYMGLKSKVGLVSAKASGLQINLKSKAVV